MEVKMNKEIRDYQESMFMGLDLRQCVCVLFLRFLQQSEFTLECVKLPDRK